MDFWTKFLTILKGKPGIFESREIPTPENRETTRPITDSFACPYCQSKNFVRRGTRIKTRETVQLYLCKDCHKTFTPHHTAQGKHYPLTTIFDAISLYNLGHSLEKSFQSAATLSDWIDEFKDNLPFLRMREYAMAKFKPEDMVITATLAHRQLYRFRFHRAKCALVMQEHFHHRNFAPLVEFLQMVPGECPHQYFTQGERASETPLTFSKTAMIVRGKTNYATKLATFVLQGAKDRKDRHEILQKFMLYNDSVTVATEVPVYLTRDDLTHMQTQLGFEIFGELPKLITGHIDILQIRNGQIHILDFKPNAEKERPIEQLTLYAMALSRLTGLRLFEFKCAWFDEKDYFEFFPLHVLHKPKKAIRRRKVATIEGTYAVNKNEVKIDRVRPL